MNTTYKAPEGKLQELADGVYAFFQDGGLFCSNSGLIVGKEYAIVIDTQTNKYQIENFIKKIKAATDKPVRFVFNTHMHTDHIYTNHYFPDATVFCSARTRQDTLRVNPVEIETFSRIHPPDRLNFEGARVTPQDMTFEGKLTIYDGKRELQFIDLGAGHSESDGIVYLPEDKIVFAGDLMVEPRGMPATSAVQGSYRLMHTLVTLAGWDAEVFVPGHGGKTMSREEVARISTAWIEFLMVMREEAHKCFNKGMTYQEAAEKIDYSKFQKWGDKEKLYPLIFGNCSRAWSEFKGEPDGSPIDIEEAFAKTLGKQADGKYLDRIDMGRSRPTGTGTK